MIELYRETVGHYRALTDADAGFRLPDEPAGLLFVSHERAAAEGMLGMFPGLATEVLEGDELRRLEPTPGAGPGRDARGDRLSRAAVRVHVRVRDRGGTPWA